MQEVLVKTHLIITDIHNEYHMNWCGKLQGAKPLLKEGLPVFVVVGSKGRTELSTIDMKMLEHTAKALTFPRGRSAVSTDSARIYLKEEDGNELLMGVLTHKNVKTFAPMFDKIHCI